MTEPAADSLRERFRHLAEIQRRVSRERNLSRLPGLVMREVTSLLEADRSTLFLLDRDTMELRACFAEGMDEGKTIVVPLRMGVIGTGILQRRTINLANAGQHPYFNPQIDAVYGYKTDSLLVVPIIDGAGQALGGIELLNKGSGRFTVGDEAAVAGIAAGMASSLAAGKIDAAMARVLLADLHGRIDFDRGTIFKLDATAGQLAAIYAEGTENVTITLNIKLGIAGLTALTGEALHIADAWNDARFDSSFDKRTGYRTRNILCLPLLGTDHEAIGVVQVINKHEGAFTAEDMELVEGVCGIVAIAVENALLFAESERQFNSLLETLAASIDARDALTAGHSIRVAVISKGIARELGFTEADIEILRVAAILHDYGKIGIDDAVLKKEGKLDEGEFAHMKQHASMTHDILDKIHFARKYRSVPLVAASHHEALNGSGYPLGLAGHEIPFMSKIIAVADCFEALTADRHYRKGMPLDKAFAILDGGVGPKFEGRIVDALRRYLDAGGYAELELPTP
jgi:HD-GYP domain-containing protein (c-di-GMP phosphodiesterase class II)